MTIYRLWIAALFLAAVSAAQSLEVVANNDRISGRVFAPVAGPMSLGMQYGYDFSRDGKHDLAAIAKVRVLELGRFTLSPEVGFGLTRIEQTDIHEWTENHIVQWNGIYIVQSDKYKTETARTPWLGTGIAGASAVYALTPRVGITGNYQRHWINNAKARHVWQAGLAWTF